MFKWGYHFTKINMKGNISYCFNDSTSNLNSLNIQNLFRVYLYDYAFVVVKFTYDKRKLKFIKSVSKSFKFLTNNNLKKY